MRTEKTIYSYSEEDSLKDGVFVDVTPHSFQQGRPIQIIVTPAVKEEFSQAAIMEMYNAFVMVHNKAEGNTDKRTGYFSIQKMNGKDVYVEAVFREEPKRKVIVKMYFPHER
jgi:hypothetical protein